MIKNLIKGSSLQLLDEIEYMVKSEKQQRLYEERIEDRFEPITVPKDLVLQEVFFETNLYYGYDFIDEEVGFLWSWKNNNLEVKYVVHSGKHNFAIHLQITHLDKTFKLDYGDGYDSGSFSDEQLDLVNLLAEFNGITREEAILCKLYQLEDFLLLLGFSYRVIESCSNVFCNRMGLVIYNPCGREPIDNDDGDEEE